MAELVIETDSLLVSRRPEFETHMVPLCGAEGEMIALENTGVIRTSKRLHWRNGSMRRNCIGRRQMARY
jgi:hypothetical protein